MVVIYVGAERRLGLCGSRSFQIDSKKCLFADEHPFNGRYIQLHPVSMQGNDEREPCEIVRLNSVE